MSKVTFYKKGAALNNPVENSIRPLPSAEKIICLLAATKQLKEAPCFTAL